MTIILDANATLYVKITPKFTITYIFATKIIKTIGAHSIQPIFQSDKS